MACSKVNFTVNIMMKIFSPLRVGGSLTGFSHTWRKYVCVLLVQRTSEEFFFFENGGSCAHFLFFWRVKFSPCCFFTWVLLRFSARCYFFLRSILILFWAGGLGWISIPKCCILSVLWSADERDSGFCCSVIWSLQEFVRFVFAITSTTVAGLNLSQRIAATEETFPL